MKLDPKTIVIDERQRQDLGDIPDLAQSLSDLGQINDITVEKQVDGLYHLVTGRRRLAAALHLNWPLISVKDHGALDPVLSQRIELEEDIKRKERTWQEKCIATAKLHKMLQREKIAEGGTWTIRNMESFTGIGKTQIAYMLQLADCFRADPRDEEMWNAENYTAAVKLLIQRTYDLANAELEVRRAKTLAVAAQPQQALPLQSLVPETDKTELEVKPEVLKIRLRGTQKEWATCVGDEDFFTERGQLLIARKPEFGTAEIMNIKAWLSREGFAIIFLPSLSEWWNTVSLVANLNLAYMPYPVLWHKLAETETKWPFQPSLEWGLVITLEKPTQINHHAVQSFISASETDDMLAYPVVEHIVSTLSFEAAPVFCFGMVNPVDIAALGRVPIWFTGDEHRFEATKALLKQHYEANIPGCEVVM